MIIEKVTLKNFKCFKETNIDFSKITILTGANSSGKSSCLYGLLSALQSTQFPLYLSPNGKYVNMGDFEEFSFNNSRNSVITLDLVINIQRGRKWNIRTDWAINSSNNMPQLQNLRAEGDIFNFSIIKNDVYVLNLRCDKEKYSKTIRFERLEELGKVLLEQNLGGMKWILDVINAVRNFDKNINFISSFRHQPERTYYQKSKSDAKAGRFGEGYIDQISEWENRKSENFQYLTSILRDLGLVRAMKVKQLKGGLFELRVKAKNDKNKGVWVSLADVGFGVSQFLPVIVADLQLSPNSTLLLAQPEIHLHPSVQAALGDYFIKQASEQNKRYIIETHSEYLLNRIRLSIAKEELKPADISVYYFENSADGSETYKIEFCKDGQIKGAPKGFFDTYMMDVMEIALHS